MGFCFSDNKTQFFGAAVDSRLIKAGQLFFALPGEKTDGHQFLRQLAGKGVTHAVVNETYQGSAFGLSLIKVSNPIQALQECAQMHLKQMGPRIVGITGSVGKTSTKGFIHTLLESSFTVYSNPGSYNSQIGLPLAILNANNNAEIFVLEMGIDSKEGMLSLINIAPPDVAVLLSVDYVHTQFYTSLHDVAMAKGSIFSHPHTKLGVIAKAVPYFEDIEKLAIPKLLTYGAPSCRPDFLLKVEANGLIIKDPQGSVHRVPLPVLGKHNAHNLLAAIIVARHFNVSWEVIKEQCAKIELPAKRLQLIEKNGITFLNDSYNACLNSMRAAMDTMPVPSSSGRRIGVFGAMRELGVFTEEHHRVLAHEALSKLDYLLCIGEDCQVMVDVWKEHRKSASIFKDKAALKKALLGIVKEGDVVLIKGANSFALWELIEHWEQSYADRTH